MRARGWPIGEARVTIDVKPRGAGRCVVRIQEEAVVGPCDAGPRRRSWISVLHWRNTETLHRLAYLAEGIGTRRSPGRARPSGSRWARTIGGELDARRRVMSLPPGGSSGGAVDAAVVGAGPNGLAAAVTLARAGLSVRVFERADQPRRWIGDRRADPSRLSPRRVLRGSSDGVRVAVLPRVRARRSAVGFVTPELSFGHPLDGGAAGLAYRDLARTRDELGRDGQAYEALFGPLARAGRQGGRLHRLDAAAGAARPLHRRRIRAGVARAGFGALAAALRGGCGARRCSPESPRTPSCPSRASRPRARDSRSRPTRMRAAGPSRSAAASRSSTRWSTTCARTAARW